jgi:DNA-binding NarL/FixJ family response regulator
LQSTPGARPRTWSGGWPRETRTEDHRAGWNRGAYPAPRFQRRTGQSGKSLMKILVCDDHAIFRAGLRVVLHDLDAELLESASCEEALEIVERDGEVDLVLLDLSLPGMDGFAGLRSLRAAHPQVAVVIVSASEDTQNVRAALAGGASGFIPKSSNNTVLLSALRIVLSGSIYVPPAILPSLQSDASAPEPLSRRPSSASLTSRQREVLQLMSRGLTNKEIGGVLGIGPGTVKAHASAIFDALDVSNRTEAVLVMRELGLGTEPGEDDPS